MRNVLRSLIPLLLVPIVAAASEPLTLTGGVLIQNNGPRTMLAYVQPDEGGVSHVLRLSAEKAFPQNPVSLQIQRATVVVDAGQLTIFDDERGVAVIFALMESQNPEVVALRHLRAFGPRRDDARVLREVVLLRGYWLGHRTMAPGQYLGMLKRDRKQAAEFCDASVGNECIDDGGTGGGSGGGGGSECSSGGRGSTQCSCSNGTASCSTTCGAGFYACCKYCTSAAPQCSCLINN